MYFPVSGIIEILISFLYFLSRNNTYYCVWGHIFRYNRRHETGREAYTPQSPFLSENGHGRHCSK